MKKALLVLFSVLGFLFAAGIIFRLIMENIDLFSLFPNSAWVWLYDLYVSAGGTGERSNLESLAGLAMAFTIATLLTLIGVLLWRRIKKR